MHAIFDERRYLIPFRATLLPQIFTDVLVIGGGVAGMRAAIEVAEGHAGQGAEVIVTCKESLPLSNTFWAQGGIAGVVSAEDSVENHLRDTLVAGAGLCDEPVVRRVVEDGPARLQELADWGMRFDRVSGGDGDDNDPADRRTWALGREGGHSHHRIVHTDGDATGKALAQTLHARMMASDRVRLFENCFVLDLITSGTTGNGSAPGACLGAITHHPKHGLQVIWAAATILASGGCGQVWRESTNPRPATGDGLAMAYRAGAELADMAFMQFHPTTLYVAGASRSLITEAVRGEGAYLVDRTGHRFMLEYDPRAELAPRDIVAQSILAQMAKTDDTHVYLDVRHLGKAFIERFPGIAKLLEHFEIDPLTELIPVHPSAHYMVGGVRVDLEGRTSVPGLFACGEVAATGLHGANRLASNSLLEGLVYGAAAGRAALALASGETNPKAIKVISDIRPSDRSELDVADVRASLRSVMWRHVGIERDGQHLGQVLEMFNFWARYTLDKIFDDRVGWEVQNLLLVGALVTRAAHWRAESRGTHLRGDYPEPVEALRVHDVWQRGEAVPRLEPVVGDAVVVAP